MRATFMRLAFASAVSLVCYQNADAVPVDAAAMKRAAISASTVQEIQFTRVLPGTASSSVTGSSSWGDSRV
jgi:hypothetical protein